MIIKTKFSTKFPKSINPPGDCLLLRLSGILTSFASSHFCPQLSPEKRQKVKIASFCQVFKSSVISGRLCPGSILCRIFSVQPGCCIAIFVCMPDIYVWYPGVGIDIAFGCRIYSVFGIRWGIDIAFRYRIYSVSGKILQDMI